MGDLSSIANPHEVWFVIYITCVVHGVHGVCEEIRKVFPEADSYVANVKKVFPKAPSRTEFFKSVAPDLALPPEPIVTRWGTWVNAVFYHAVNYEKLETVL